MKKSRKGFQRKYWRSLGNKSGEISERISEAFSEEIPGGTIDGITKETTEFLEISKEEFPKDKCEVRPGKISGGIPGEMPDKTRKESFEKSREKILKRIPR